MKSETVTYTIPWYALTPSPLFIYKDKITKLWFVIEQLGRGSEVQGAGYALTTAYSRYVDECLKGKKWPSPLDKFKVFDTIERVMSYQVRN